MSSRRCESCFKTYAHRQSLFNHKKKCKGASTNENQNIKGRLQSYQCSKSTSQHSASQSRKEMIGGSLKSDETLRQIMEMVRTQNESNADDGSTEIDVPGENDEKDEEPMKVDNRPRDTAMFEDVTLGDKNKFTLLLNKLKKHLKEEDFVKIDNLLPQYFKNESKFNDYGWGRTGEDVRDEIGQELRSFQRQGLPLLSLELQILLEFMDKKRQALNDLLAIIKNGDKDDSLERVSLHGVITEDEKRQFMKELSRDAIARVLSNRKFTPMNSEI